MYIKYIYFYRKIIKFKKLLLLNYNLNLSFILFKIVNILYIDIMISVYYICINNQNFF